MLVHWQQLCFPSPKERDLKTVVLQDADKPGLKYKIVFPSLLERDRKNFDSTTYFVRVRIFLH